MILATYAETVILNVVLSPHESADNSSSSWRRILDVLNKIQKLAFVKMN